jgi:hypothetical protein
MSIVTTSPTLSYVSSQDTSIAPSGSTNYMILFDQQSVTYGNVIMFEYKLQTVNSTIPDLVNTSFGFVAIENAIQSGIANQYIISVPAQETTNTGTPIETIQLRVYFGANNSNDVVVTDWSNELDVYLPPTTPVIYTKIDSPTFGGAYYDPASGTLNVLLKASENVYDYDNIQFIVCFFYQDSNNNTLWKVSDPTTATSVSLGTTPFRIITVPLDGTVSTTEGYEKVYASIHAVYDWQTSYYNISYHSVSFISNEVVAVNASSDSDPNITSVVYNVYTAAVVEVPGDQSMTVTWEAPGNSPLPFFNVAYYDLYYSLNGGAFTLYVDNLSSTTLDYTVNVGSSGTSSSNPLDLQCGDSIVFRVNAIDVQGTDSPSPDSVSTNIFKYSEAVTNLEITDVTYAEGYMSNIVGLTVNFDGVSTIESPNKGCGNGLQYVVEINDTVYSGTGSLVYVSEAQYSIVYSGLDIPQVGDVKVYLQTSNTNPLPTSPLDGIPSVVPYISNNLVLSPVAYQVYVTQLNEDQYMNLSWTDPTVSGWSVQSYDVEYSTDSGITWANATNTNSNTYIFDASNFALVNPPTYLIFRIKANMTNSGTTYIITSNEESQYTFKYSIQPQSAMVNWSIGNNDSTAMDINVQFTNPTFLGVNDGFAYFLVQVYNLSDVAISTSQTVTLIPGTNPYIVNFNDVVYASSGYVKIQPFVYDSNSGYPSTVITSIEYDIDAYYVTSTVPLFQNVEFTGATVTGDILTATVLKPIGEVVYPNPEDLMGDLLTKPYSTLGTTAGFEISYIILPNGEFKYSFILNTQVFLGFLPTEEPPSGALTASNDAGIGSYVVQLNQAVNP